MSFTRHRALGRCPAQTRSSIRICDLIAMVEAQFQSKAMSPPTRRGLNRIQAAGYVGLSPSKFDELVADGRMPRAIKIDARRVWDVRQIDLAFDALPGEAGEDTPNPWDSVYAPQAS